MFAAIICAGGSALAQPAGGSYQKPFAAADPETLWRRGLFEEAERAALDRIALSGEDGAARHVLSRAAWSRRDLQAARREIDAALAVDGGRPDWNYAGAAIYTALGLPAAAAVFLGRYLSSAGSAGEPDARLGWAAAEVALFRTIGSRARLRISEPEQAQPIRFEIIGDHIYVPVEINGRAAKAMIDTGAERTVVSEELASVAGVPTDVASRGPRANRVGWIDRLAIGGWTIRGVPAIVKSARWRNAPHYGGEAISPLAFGLSMRIDYSRRELTLARELPEAAADVRLPLWQAGLPLVRASVEAEPVMLVVDTGAQGTVIAQSVVDRLGPVDGQRVAPMKLFNGSARRDTRSQVVVPGFAIDLGAWRIPRRPAVTMDLDAASAIVGFELGGLIGHHDLQNYIVTFDLARGTLSLSRPR